MRVSANTSTPHFKKKSNHILQTLLREKCKQINKPFALTVLAYVITYRCSEQQAVVHGGFSGSTKCYSARFRGKVSLAKLLSCQSGIITRTLRGLQIKRYRRSVIYKALQDYMS